MAKKTIAARSGKSKEGFRGKLTGHEITLLAEMYASGMTAKAIAARFG